MRFNLSLRIILAAFVCCFVALGAKPACAIEVEEVLWGFDGRAHSNAFNPLSMLISNPSPEPFEGALRLQRRNGARERVGAVIEEQVFVSPFASRWVQFYPYVMEHASSWTLSWNRGSRRFNVPPHAISPQPAQVILEAPGNLITGSGTMKRLPENLFPPTVTATSTLGTVVLDHPPRWEEARRQAFREWLYRGGVVHVIHGPDGKYPVFPGTLSELQAPLEVNRVGAGLVFRHPRRRGELDRKFVDSVIRRISRPAANPPTENRGEEAAAGNETDGVPADEEEFDTSAITYNYGDWDSDGGFFSNLKQMTRVKHNWLLIYLMALVYILLIFPGCYVLGHLRVDYRLTLGALLATVAVFSLSFSYVGRRGYGESTAVHSVAIARPLTAGEYDVFCRSNVFATDGDFYTVEHEGSGGLYSTCQEIEAVNGRINNSLEGQFQVDIPPYSSRTFAHRIKLKGKPISVGIDTWDAGETLRQLVVSTGEHFPETTQPIYALYRDRFYTMTRHDGRLQLKTNVGSVSGFLRLDEYSEFRNRPMGMWFGDEDDERTPEQRFHSMLQPLLARVLGVSNEKEIEAFSLPEDRVRLFVYTPMTEEFFIRNSRLGRQAGYVLYCFDLFAPEAL